VTNIATTTGDGEGFIIGSPLIPKPDIVKNGLTPSQIAAAKKKKKKGEPCKHALFYGNDTEVYLLDIWVTMCPKPNIFFILFVPELARKGGSIHAGIQKVFINQIMNTYYCDIRSTAGSQEEFNNGIK
jgi:hypothetical protein